MRPCAALQATKGRETLSFYTMPEYEEWKETHNTRGWSIKYYKVGCTPPALCRCLFWNVGLPMLFTSQGCIFMLWAALALPPGPAQGLGTSTPQEAKQYFANIASHRKEFVWDGEEAWPVRPQQNVAVRMHSRIADHP